ncbi:pyridoxal-phosphate dependent enzyme [Pikeienuella piscinae]|uniref:Pyridoxal-phosphate dependent enzyme n=2 Tax=Pikeienuella piscinae TaxID=2748098 RepID=A0A7L5BZA5_9RHOB|nr:pyridoxal-phosphate dependent enzyme [Pikeienuella piscinae]
MHAAHLLLFDSQRRDDRPDRGVRSAAERPLALLSSCPAYEASPLCGSPRLARESGVSALLVKDETARMGLGSFKALGGAFAVARIILDRAGVADVTSPAALGFAAKTVFTTASAGNHGLSVAPARGFSRRARKSSSRLAFWKPSRIASSGAAER